MNPVTKKINDIITSYEKDIANSYVPISAYPLEQIETLLPIALQSESIAFVTHIATTIGRIYCPDGNGVWKDVEGRVVDLGKVYEEFCNH